MHDARKQEEMQKMKYKEIKSPSYVVIYELCRQLVVLEPIMIQLLIEFALVEIYLYRKHSG